MNRRRAIEVMDSSQWIDVNRELKDFQAHGRTQLAVDLIYRFERSNPAASNAPAPGSLRGMAVPAPGSMRATATRQLLMPVPNNATERLLVEREVTNSEDIEIKKVDELLAYWKCTDIGCPNNQNIQSYSSSMRRESTSSSTATASRCGQILY